MDVLVCVHGNTIRAIRMMLHNLDGNGVVALEIPTGGLYCYAIGTDSQVMSLATL